MPDLTAQMDQALAALAAAKEAKDSGTITEKEYRTVKREANEARGAWRTAEEAAGRRSGRVGGDAFRSGG